ncbi:hypothetical protein BJ742DRAFT_765783 [Cladochytrium replicatum]|nr:hypothetical protein BJ742DRAFT_765783 [Cladochytrium replicatum]
MNTFVYDFMVALFYAIVRIFFREIRHVGTHKIPKFGPVLFVAAPHANQFIDPLMLMTTSPRRIGFLIAKKSFDRPFIGLLARAFGSIPVARSQDYVKKPKGTIYLPDPTNTPLVLKGIDTTFVADIASHSTISFSGGSAEVAEVISDTELRLKKPFASPEAVAALTLSTEPASAGVRGFKVTPIIDQHAMFDGVVEKFADGECVGIFPEGGSHDRSDLLPLKAGFAIMALTAMVKHRTRANNLPPLEVMIVPVSLSYFHPDKFRSRTVVEYGDPIRVDPELVQMYARGGPEKRVATGKLMDVVTERLRSLTVTAPDYNSLMLIQATRRLYRPLNRKLSIEENLELTRRFAHAYGKFQRNERVAELVKRVAKYNKMLEAYSLRDHQVKTVSVGGTRELRLLGQRLLSLLLMALFASPGTVIHLPIMLIANQIAIHKAKEAKAGSTVKIEGKDVVGTWKVLSTLFLTPAFYTMYCFLYHLYLSFGQGRPFFSWYCFLVSYLAVPPFLFSMGVIGLQAGETGMDVLRSIWPLFLAIVAPQSMTAPLRTMRTDLQVELSALISELGPELFGTQEAFELSRIVRPSDVDLSNRYAKDYVRRGRRVPGSSGAIGDFSWEEVDDKEWDDDVFLFRKSEEQADSPASEYAPSNSSNSYLTVDNDDWSGRPLLTGNRSQARLRVRDLSASEPGFRRVLSTEDVRKTE